MAAISKVMEKIFRRKRLSRDAMTTPLRRCLSVFDLAMIGASNMISSGIYVLSGVVAREEAGPGIVLSYLFAGFAMLLSSVCYAEFGARVPKAGSAFTFTYTTLGEVWAFVVGWDGILERMLSAAASSKGWSAMLDAMLHGAIRNYTLSHVGAIRMEGFADCPDLVALAVTMATLAIVSAGVELLTNTNIVLTIINVLSLVVVVVIGFVVGSWRNWTTDSPGGFLPFGIRGVFAGTATLFYTFVGFESINCAAEEASDPSRQIPLATIVAMLFTVVLYVTAGASLTLMVPYDLIDLNTPFPSAFRFHGMPWAVYFVSAGSLPGISTSLLLDQYALARNVYAMAGDGLFFKIFAWVQPTTRTPILASLTFGTVVALLSLLLEYRTLIEFLSIGTLISFTTVAVCVLINRYCPPDPESCSDLAPDGKTMDNEKTAIVRKTGERCDRSAPVLKDCFQRIPCIAEHRGRHLIYAAIMLILVGTLALMSVVTFKRDNNWLFFVFLTLGVIVVVAGICLLLMHEQRKSPSTFNVPFVPFVPVASIIMNISLLLQLRGIAWLRYVAWLVIGLTIYFLYGVHHSELNQCGTDDVTHGTQYSSTDATEKPISNDKSRECSRLRFS